MSCSGSHLQEVLCFETPLHHFPSAMPRARQRRLVVGVWAQESGSLCIPVPPLTVPSCVSSINCYSVFLLLPLFYPIAPGHEPSSRSSGWVPTIQGHQLMPKRFSASCQQSEYWGSPCTRSGRFLIGWVMGVSWQISWSFGSISSNHTLSLWAWHQDDGCSGLLTWDEQHQPHWGPRSSGLLVTIVF
jgi:hypothetical protein